MYIIIIIDVDVLEKEQDAVDDEVNKMLPEAQQTGVPNLIG